VCVCVCVYIYICVCVRGCVGVWVCGCVGVYRYICAILTVTKSLPCLIRRCWRGRRSPGAEGGGSHLSDPRSQTTGESTTLSIYNIYIYSYIINIIYIYVYAGYPAMPEYRGGGMCPTPQPDHRWALLYNICIYIYVYVHMYVYVMQATKACWITGGRWVWLPQPDHRWGGSPLSYIIYVFTHTYACICMYMWCRLPSHAGLLEEDYSRRSQTTGEATTLSLI